MFSEIKCEQDLETAIRLADRCANLSRSTTSLRVRLFDEAQSMPLSADAARLHDRGLPADELSKSSLSWTCLGDGSDSNRVSTMECILGQSKMIAFC